MHKLFGIGVAIFVIPQYRVSQQGVFTIFFLKCSMTARPKTGLEDKVRVVVPHEGAYSLNNIAERSHVARRTIQELIQSTERLVK